MTKLVQDTNAQALSSQTGRVLAEFQELAGQTRRLVERPEIRAMVSDAAARCKERDSPHRRFVRGIETHQDRIRTIPRRVRPVGDTVQRMDRLMSNKSQDIEDTVENLRVMSENLREITDNAKRYPAQVFLANLRLGRGRQSDNPSGIAVPDFIGICLVPAHTRRLRESWQELSGEALLCSGGGTFRRDTGLIPGTVLKVRKFRSLAGF